MMLFSGCVGGSVSSEKYIKIASICNDPIDTTLIAVSYRQVSLDRDSLIIGNIKDIAADSNSYYILDEYGTIAHIPADSSIQANYIHDIGEGPEEYLRPCAISMHKDTLYVLDFPTKKIHRYSTELNYISSITLENTAENFTVTDNGIITENFDKTPGSFRYNLYDFNGQLKSKLCKRAKTTEPISFIIPSTQFLNTAEGNTFALDGYSNSILLLSAKQ